MSSHKTQDSFDKRLIERNIKHGHYTRKDVASHLDGLPDSANKGISLGKVEDARIADLEASATTATPTPES